MEGNAEDGFPSLSLLNTPIEITCCGKHLVLKNDDPNAKEPGELILHFRREGSLNVCWFTIIPLVSFYPPEVSREVWLANLYSDPVPSDCLHVYDSDDFVLRQDFEVAKAYWLPQDGIIRLTRDALFEAYREMKKRDFPCPRASAYNPPHRKTFPSRATCNRAKLLPTFNS